MYYVDVPRDKRQKLIFNDMVPRLIIYVASPLHGTCAYNIVTLPRLWTFRLQNFTLIKIRYINNCLDIKCKIIFSLVFKINDHLLRNLDCFMHVM